MNKNHKNSLEALQGYHRQKSKPSQNLSSKRNILFLKSEDFKDVNLPTYGRHRKESFKNKLERTGGFISSLWLLVHETDSVISFGWKEVQSPWKNVISVFLWRWPSLYVINDRLVKNMNQLSTEVYYNYYKIYFIYWPEQIHHLLEPGQQFPSCPRPGGKWIVHGGCMVPANHSLSYTYRQQSPPNRYLDVYWLA